MRRTWTVLLLFAVGGLGQVWTPHDPLAIDIAHRLGGPMPAYPLGLDALGRDLFSRLLAGAGVSFGVAGLACAIGAGVGIPAGLLAAARPGRVNTAVGIGADILFALPALLLALVLAAVRGPDALNAALAIGVFNIPVFTRVTAAPARSLWTREFVAAARMAGRGRLGISAAHILPNLAPTLAAQGAIQFALGLLAEAGLAYVGLGTQPPAPSWGRMLNEAQPYLATDPWLAVWPGLAIVGAVLIVTRLGDRIGRP